MRKKAKLLKKQRRYAETFKRSIVAQFETGQYSVSQLSRLHGISFQSIYKWIHCYSTHNEKGTRIVEYSDSSQEKLRQLERQLAEAERLLGQKQIQIEYLDKLIELASEELQIDLKKNFVTSPSPTFKPTKK